MFNLQNAYKYTWCSNLRHDSWVRKKGKLQFNDQICIFKQIAAITELFFVDVPGPPYPLRALLINKMSLPVKLTHFPVLLRHI